MQRVLTLAVPVAALLAALAQPAAAATILHLSETGHVMVQPDQLTASLSLDATGATPVAAQAQVNGGIGKALTEAKAAPGITPTTGFYRVWQQTKPSNEWHASQQLELKQEGNGEALLKLVATLQGQGLALNQLGWQVSPEAARHAHDEAVRMALTALRGRVEEAAGILGLRFISFRQVDLDPGRPAPLPVARNMAMAVSAQAMPVPSAAADEVTIQATVTADADLEPKTP